MKDLLLTAAGDLDCSALGVQLVGGAARVAQQVRTRLRTFLGEWEFDLDAGVPWFQRILGIKGVNLNDVEDIIKTQILSVADVKSISAIKMTFNGTTRKLSITSKVDTNFGTVQVEGVFP